MGLTGAEPALNSTQILILPKDPSVLIPSLTAI